jgi:hypothetical protein
VPPEPDAVAVPVELPRHDTFVCEGTVAATAVGSVMLTVAVAVQVCASVTVTV